MEYIVNYNSQIYKFDNPWQLAAGYAQYLQKLVERSEKDQFHIALSGGNTPKLLFNHLASEYKERIKWEIIHFWWGDERMVPPKDNESNYKMTNENLFSLIYIPKENIHRIHGEDDPEKEAARYSSEIKRHLTSPGNLPIFDLVILGMGEDGHTASIFPHQMHLLKSANICEVVQHPISKQNRITLTGPVINNALEVTFLVTGISKAEKIEQILSGSENSLLYPASHIKPVGNLYWFVDKFALKNCDARLYANIK